MVVRQVIDRQLDEGAFDDRQRALVACPGAAGLQPGRHPVPGAGGGGAVPGSLGERGHLWCMVGGLVSELEFTPVTNRPALLAGLAGRAGEGSHTPRLGPSRPATSTGRSLSRYASRAGSYPASKITRMPRVASPPVPGGDQPADDLADLGGGHRSQLIIRAEPDRV